LAALAFGSYAVARWTPLFAVRSIEVVGADRGTAVHVRAALQPLEGRSLVALRSADVQLPLSRLPEVVSASYDRSFPNTLIVFVRPEHPVAVLRRGNESWLVSARGRAISRLRVGGRAGLPRIWVGQNVSVALGALISDQSTLRAARTLALSGIAALPQIRTARSGEEGLTLVLASGLEVRLGRDEMLPLKLAVAARILRKLDLAAEAKTLYLDLSVPERPVAAIE
jgi:cell division protein FtsQ